MIYKEINFCAFEDEFKGTLYENNFSYEALEELFNYYDNLDENYELDVTEIAGDWTEWDSLADYNGDNGTEFGTVEELKQHTTVLTTNKSILVMDY